MKWKYYFYVHEFCEYDSSIIDLTLIDRYCFDYDVRNLVVIGNHYASRNDWILC